MTLRRPAAIAALMALPACLTGCAVFAPSSSSSSTDRGLDRPLPAVISAEGLPPQSMAPGDCGLFLWTRETPRHFKFFQKAGETTALIDISGTPVTLARTGTDGSLFGQFMTEQAWRDADQNTYTVSLVPGAELEGGQRAEAAEIIQTDPEGWQTIMPVVGLRACQSENVQLPPEALEPVSP